MSSGIYAWCYNMLMSCEENAILITVGDNDTYPLHYVQEQLGFRKDVLIVNVSLLGSTRHTNSYKDKVNEAIPMTSSIDYPYNEYLQVPILGRSRDHNPKYITISIRPL